MAAVGRDLPPAPESPAQCGRDAGPPSLSAKPGHLLLQCVCFATRRSVSHSAARFLEKRLGFGMFLTEIAKTRTCVLGLVVCQVGLGGLASTSRLAIGQPCALHMPCGPGGRPSRHYLVLGWFEIIGNNIPKGQWGYWWRLLIISLADVGSYLQRLLIPEGNEVTSSNCQ